MASATVRVVVTVPRWRVVVVRAAIDVARITRSRRLAQVLIDRAPGFIARGATVRTAP